MVAGRCRPVNVTNHGLTPTVLRKAVNRCSSPKSRLF
jgi:hypothetical protein